MLSVIALTSLLTACEVDSIDSSTTVQGSLNGTDNTLEPIDLSALDFSQEAIFTVASLSKIRDAYNNAGTSDEKAAICERLLLQLDDIDIKTISEGMASLSAQETGMGDVFQNLRFSCGHRDWEYEATHEPTPTPTNTRNESVRKYTESEVFSPAVVDIINEFDLGGDSVKLQICSGLSKTLSGMNASQMQSSIDGMDFYSASILQDLVTDCNRLIDLQ